MSGPKRPILGLLFKALSAAGICVLALGGCYAMTFGKLDWREYQVRRPVHYEVCATNLALFCQTFEPFFTVYPFDRPAGAFSLPICVGFLDRYHAVFRSAPGANEVGIQLRYGAGFEDYGYYLEKTDGAPASFTTWRLKYYIESRQNVLKEFSLPSKARFPVTEFLPEATPFYLTAAVEANDPVYESMKHIRFLLMTGHPLASNYLATVVRQFPQATEPRIAYAAMLTSFDRREDAIRMLTEWTQISGTSKDVYWVEKFRRSLGVTNIALDALTPPAGLDWWDTDFPRLIGAIREARNR